MNVFCVPPFFTWVFQKGHMLIFLHFGHPHLKRRIDFNAHSFETFSTIYAASVWTGKFGYKIKGFTVLPESNIVTRGVRSLLLAWFTASSPSSIILRTGSPQFNMPFATNFSSSSTLTPKAYANINCTCH